MDIQIDTREHKSELNRITAQLDRLGVSYFVSKLYVGDYQSLDNPRLVIDRKKDLQELIGNITQQHERFREELIRARDHGIKIIILCEHGDGINSLEDVFFWRNPRLDMMDWKVVDGKPKRVQKYPKATTGQSLYKAMQSVENEYGVEFRFCDKENVGENILKLLDG